MAITFGAITIGLLTFKREADEQSDPSKSPVDREFRPSSPFFASDSLVVNRTIRRVNLRDLVRYRTIRRWHLANTAVLHGGSFCFSLGRLKQEKVAERLSQ